MASQRFCLRWNNHQSNMLSVFDQLLHAETFTDVTLAVDGQLLKAHKMVLSACSPYFQALFVNHQEKHPIVILKDVPYADMKSLLDFMYRGEVSVDQERLTAFLKVAESLRIKGLTEVNEEKCDLPSLTNSLIQQQQSAAHTPPPQLHRIHPYINQKRPSGMPTGGAPPNLLMPLLGNALMQPKRKRGRPRKLSGSSSDALTTAASPPGEYVPETANAQSNRVGEPLVRSSPEMLDVKMDNFNADDGGTSGGEDCGEALLIDEGDDGHSRETPMLNKDTESADRGTPDSENKAPSPLGEGKIRINPATQATTSDSLLDFEDDFGADNVPIITLEILSDSDDSTENPNKLPDVNGTQTKFRSVEDRNLHNNYTIENETGESELSRDGKDAKHKKGLLEYTTRDDGSVICKLCGEVFQTRTYWYRHKYRAHVIQPWHTMPLFQCETCQIYFKSRKGYLAHIASRHSELHADCQPVLFNAQVQITAKQNNVENNDEVTNKDPELEIPKTTVPKSNAVSVISGKKAKSSASLITSWEEQRSREDKLVADIIDRVKRECEAQGSGGPARRGYSRKPSINS